MSAARISERLMPTRTKLRQCEIRLGRCQTITRKYSILADHVDNAPELQAICDELWFALFGYDRR